MKTRETKSQNHDFDQADLVERMEISLSKTQEKDLSQWLDQQRSAMDQDRNRFLERHKKYLYNWDDFVTFNRKGPWEDSSNLHMPLTAIKVKSYISKLYNIFTDESTTQLIPREETDEKHVDMVRLLRKWYLLDYLNGFKGIRGFAREIFYDTVTVGFGIGMKDWMVKVRKIIDIEENELKKEMNDLAPQVEEAKGPVLQTEEEMDTSSVNVKPYREVQKILTFFEGTRLQSIPFENAFFPNFIPESNDLDFPPAVIIETEFTLSDVMLKGARGEWNKKKVELVKNFTAMTQEPSAQEIKDHRNNLSGVDDTNQRYAKEKRLIQYGFCSYDIDDDGIDEEIVIVKCKTEILKVMFLDRISPSGMRPLFKFDCFSKPRQAYSRGVPEFLYPLNEEMDQHHNMRIDYISLQTCPFGVYRAASSLKNQPIRISPGKFVPVDDITDMRILNFPTNATVLSAEEDRLWHYADLLTDSSSLSQGIVPDQVGPTRSTSGVTTLLRQMEKQFVLTVDQCAQQWKKMEKMVLDDLDYRISPQIKMRVLGAAIDNPILDNPQAGDALMINAQFDMEIDVARAVTSEEIQRNDAEMILNKLAAPSILQQSGVVGPKTLYRALGEWLKAFGKDPRQYINMPKFIDIPLNLYQEIQICGQNEMPPMAMQDDHQLKAQGLQAFLQAPEYMEAKEKGFYRTSADQMIMKAAQAHLALFEQMTPKGLPNPQGNNGQDMTQVQSGTAPQQGGESPEKTTSRELPEKTQEPEAASAGG